MQFVLSITHKPATSGGSTGADSGYSYESGDMQWDVEVYADYDTFAGMLAHFDASNGGDPSVDPDPPPEVGWRWKRVQALIDARRVLRNDKDCAKFFGLLKRSGKVNERKLAKLVSGARFMVDGEAYQNIAHTDGEKVTLERGFFKDSWYRGSTAPYSLTNPRQGRVQTILHELGHVKGLLIAPDNWGYPTDANSPVNQNNKTILDHCGKGLAKVPESYEEDT